MASSKTNWKKNTAHDGLFSIQGFSCQDYFSTPSEQLKQLQYAGFSDTKAYGLNSGKVVLDPANMLDYYVYFLAKAK